MLNYKLIEGRPTAEEYIHLRKLVGWKSYDAQSVEKALDNSLYILCAVCNETVIGIVRITGDKSISFYIQDVIVDPEYQRNGIGKAMMQKTMQYISYNASPGAFVVLMSAKGKEQFYKNYGFWERPNEKFGSGMMKYLEQDIAK
jgi:ribosomal protein S18 acetylase RimI-like enzyme